MRHNLILSCGKSVNSHPRKREYARHLSHGALRPIQVAGLQVFRDQPLISLTPAAVKVQFLILVFGCIIATGVNDFFYIFFPFI
uniref:Uncharacterized protein n=1 Tax=Siphoviridae sp. ctCb814 TaxID=2827808 RepID=A0A8S5SNB6_9CAUD|nr:MAG TPA: hypothetical protein [Siphoviridae sp. ctCb814]